MALINKSINPTIYVFPDKDVEYGLDKSNPIFAKGYVGIFVS